MKLLLMDVGNTSTLFGYQEGARCRKIDQILTQDLTLSRLFKLKNRFPQQQTTAILLSSVVPRATRFLEKNVPRVFRQKLMVIGKDLSIPIDNKYRKPKQVGADRLLNAAAVFHKYKKDAIVIDFGTAITFDVVSKKGEYLGGVIAPGIEISLEALFQKTALLPKIRMAHPKGWIGRDTIESIRIGCSVGIGGLCDRIVEKIRKQYRLNPLVIATGGYARFMSRYCQTVSEIDSRLIFDGMVLSYRHFLSRK